MKKICLLFLLAAMVSGCGLTKEDLGMARSKPDETKVMKREALVVPPDFDVKP